MAVATITIVYTFLGGMKAVIWTDVIQFSVYIVGAAVALVILAGKLPGGWTELIDTAQDAGKFRVLDFTFDLKQPYTFWAGLIGGMVLNTATHGADQMMVQRDLSARSQRQAAGGAGGQRLPHPGPVRPLPLHRRQPVGVLPAVPAYGGRGIGRRRVRRSDEAFSYFIVHYLPTGLLGLVIAAVFSAAMGTLAGSLELVGLVDRQRPVPARHRPGRRAAPDAGLAGDDGGLGPGPGGRGLRLPGCWRTTSSTTPWRSPASSRASCSGCSCWGS